MANKTQKIRSLIQRLEILPTVIFDVGCFDGEQCIEFAKAFPESEVYGFEAAPANAAKAIDRCEGYNRIRIIPCAAHFTTGIREFQESVSANQECGSLLVPNGQYPEPMPFRTIAVPTIRMDLAITALNCAVPDVLWLDVQGSEPDVIQSFGEQLAEVKVVWSEVAYRPYYFSQMTADKFEYFMEVQGFVKVDEEVGVEGWFGDFCFVRRDLAEKLGVTIKPSEYKGQS